MVCSSCGRSSSLSSGRCPACGAAFAQTTVATGVVPFDTTGLPPGASFGATISPATGQDDLFGGTTSLGTAAPTGGDTPPIPTAGPLKVGQAFGARYHVIKLLGAGGMGAVYQAWDAELSVAVAVKVIRTDKRRGSVSVEAEKRFKNELLLARQVTHKNVVRIHDLGEIDGVKYITMSYVQGDDLGTVLRRDGKFPIARALHLARQIAAGLEAAHEAGVVHRDLKPPNIMVGADDLALIMDFGISASRDETATGHVVGTLEYMAPEQSKGDAVDARADIYAFGLMLYEMLTGPRATPSNSGQERIEAMKQRVAAGLPPARALDESIPEPLDALVTRCLAIDPAARFQTTTELSAALARLDDHGLLIPEVRRLTKPMLAVAVTLVAALVTATWWLSRGPVAPVTHPPVSVVVADFDNRTGDPAFAGAVESALGVGIEGASFINAFPRGDAQKLAEQYKAGSRVDERIARLISVREGINLILSGSIEQQGSGYVLSAKLIDTAKQIDNTLEPPPRIITAKAASKADVLKAVSSLAEQVRRTLGDTTPAPQLRAADETLTAASLDAIRSYAQAQDFANDDKDEQAAEYYRRAIALDPNFGRAYAGLALSTELLGRKEESAELWKKALALQDRMTEREKYRTLGVYYGRVARNDEKAIEMYTELVKRYPADATGYNNMAVAYFRTRDFAKAFEAGRRALEIAPKRERYQTNYALYAMYAGDFTQAAQQAARIVKEHPDATYAYVPLAVAALAQGKPDAARDAYQRMAKTGAVGGSWANMGLVDLAMHEGRYDEADALLKPGLAEDRRTKNTTLMATKYLALAEVYLARRNTPLALDAVRQALALGTDQTIAVPAARLFLQAGNETEPRRIASELLTSLQAERRAYGHLITGEIARRNRRTIDAVDSFRAAIKLTDLWLARFSLGVTYVDAGGHDAEALSELDACVKRKGEATSIFFDDVPTFRYLVSLPYWLGRAQVGVGLTKNAADNFKQFLTLRPDVARDPLAADATRRLAALTP